MQQSIIRPKQAAALFGVSLSTLWNWNKAKRELLESGLITVSRQGGKNQCTLYALTFLAIDDCGGKLDMGETCRAPDDWKRRHYELSPATQLKQH